MRRILTLTLFLAAFNMIAQTVFVSPNGSGNGTSWADAAGDLKAVLNTATPNMEIWVKEGTYRPTVCSSCDLTDREQSFIIPEGVQLLGGFSGTENDLAQRNLLAHPTYLSGDIDGDATVANNSFTIVYTENVSPLTVVDGFIIVGGNADLNTAGLDAPSNSGAGWFNRGSSPNGASSPTIRNCRFERNHSWGYGGAMYNDGSFEGNANPLLEKCIFTENTSRVGGAGMYNAGSFQGQASPTLTNCLFENNRSLESEGGGMFNTGAEQGEANPILTGCVFSGNIAFHNGGALYNFGFKGNSSPMIETTSFIGNVAFSGGAVYSDGTFNGHSAATFSYCQFVENIATGSDGGAIYNSGYQGICSPNYFDCIFQSNNSAFAGGAMFNNGVEGQSNPGITNCRFIENTADTYGGAIYNQGKGNASAQINGNASPQITNCLFQNNSALSAGAVYNLGAEMGNANASITNCTFYGNHANVGGALYCNAGEGGTGTSSPNVRNCIFWDNNASAEGDIFRIIWGTPSISYSLIDKPDCDALYNGNGGVLNCGENLIFNEDALFVHAETGDFHLLSGSPAIDVGSNDATEEAGAMTDLDNLPRIHNGIVDIGVFEFGSDIGAPPVIIQHPFPLSVCEGDMVEFTVNAVGEPPNEFQWLKNGIDLIGETGNTLSIPSASLNDNAVYTCEVTGTTGQSTLSNEAQLTVHELVEAGLQISASQVEICEGEEILLNATVENEGLSPMFQWSVNGSPIVGGSASISFIPQNGDEFTCEMFSSHGCVSNNPTFSNGITIETHEILSPLATIYSSADSSICLGEEVIFSIETEHAGGSPTYDWKVNGESVNANEDSFSTQSLEDMDAVTCEVVSSETCVDTNPILSNEITFSVDSCSVKTEDLGDPKSGMLVYPNPTNGKFFMHFSTSSANFTVHLLNIQGQKIMSEVHGNPSTPYTRELNLTHFPKGVYYLQIVTDKYLAVEKIVVE